MGMEINLRLCAFQPGDRLILIQKHEIAGIRIEFVLRAISDFGGGCTIPTTVNMMLAPAALMSPISTNLHFHGLAIPSALPLG
jgi:hypothetical protein